MYDVMSLQSVAATIRRLHLSSPNNELSFETFGFELTEQKPCCCVTGESGAGKTTFFKSLIPRFVAEWREQSSVEIEVDLSRNGIDLLSSNGRIGYASQRPFFIAHRTVRENLLEPFRWASKPQPTAARVNEIVRDFSLERIVDRKAYQLSAGERQRLNLARMFLAQPELAMIDECLSPMDEDLAAEIAARIRDKYLRSCRLLVTGHRKKDLLCFADEALRFSYEDQSDVKPRRQIKVERVNLQITV